MDSDLDEKETTNRWCQGVVINVSDGTNMVRGHGSRRKYKRDEAVMVLWDPIPDLGHPSCESAQVLLQSKWNKHVIGGWRMDLKIDS